MIHIDQKYTIWERFSIEDENKEALESFLKENPKASGLDIYDWAHEQGLDPHCEMLEGTQESLDILDNGGEATLEIIQGMKTIHSNKE
jgi:hypothetical protein